MILHYTFLSVNNRQLITSACFRLIIYPHISPHFTISKFAYIKLFRPCRLKNTWKRGLPIHYFTSWLSFCVDNIIISFYHFFFQKCFYNHYSNRLQRRPPLQEPWEFIVYIQHVTSALGIFLYCFPLLPFFHRQNSTFAHFYLNFSVLLIIVWIRKFRR